jgi:hypothetical protein
MRDPVKALLVTLSLAGAACGSSGGGKDVGKFIGVWGAPTGSEMTTCTGQPQLSGTEQVTTPETWAMGSTSDLVQTVASLGGCVFHANVSANTATGTPSQTCTVTGALPNGDPATEVLTFTAYTFVVSSDGLTATENLAGNEVITDNASAMATDCTFTQSASYTKQ